MRQLELMCYANVHADTSCLRSLILERDVNHALLIQHSHSGRLQHVRGQCLDLLTTAREYLLMGPVQHRQDVTLSDFEALTSNVQRMLASVDQAITTSREVQDAPAMSLGDSFIPTGRQGRPSIAIDAGQLANLAINRTTRVDLATLFHCSSRTIRRRLLEYGFSAPGPPVYVDEENQQGEMICTYHPGRSADLSDITNDELDEPSFGRRMIDGFLLEAGFRVPHQQILDAYNRVIGPAVRPFGPTRLSRREYNVPGPNSLWHQDGQHGLIHWGIIFHGFIDGYARFVLGIWASNNNRAATVGELFQDITGVFGYPSWVRGDFGTENLIVAAEMERVRGLGRGSYIWGKSVHNIRIEHLWLDLTQGLGKKWKLFFLNLELHHNLDRNDGGHIWLLHHLFLNVINKELDLWIGAWNNHTLSSRTERHTTPKVMYVQGSAINGYQSVHVDPVTGETSAYIPLDDPALSDDQTAAYGVDWDDALDTRLRNHHDEHNTHQADATEPDVYVSNVPDQLSQVEVLEPNCPFSSNTDIQELDEFLDTLPHRQECDEVSHTELWRDALEKAVEILGRQDL
ncbi:hypothetical protein D9758_014738 [Tetrapyrgos nigripes]|uniref:Integrase catalytic domain-containing protein n=1 Tax=Tetrapyrgos nigripes TaxID=182062 RepID=A0A8H5CGR8_9AGAR|nr:hypothetical protein D9758_014738 [Tetrapyrgos nigripes]